MRSLRLVGVATAVLAIALAGCSSAAQTPTRAPGPAQTPTTAPGPAQTPTTAPGPAGVPAAGQSPAIDRILKNGYIKVGVFAGPPWLVQSTSGSAAWSGTSWTLAQEVAKRLGVTLQLVNVGDATKVTSVQTGQIDISITPLNETDKRKQVIDFVTYSKDGYCWFAKKTNDKVNTADDLNKPGIVDAEVSGGGPASTLPGIYPNLKIFEYVAAPGEVYALQPVLTGQADVAGFDNILVYQIQKQYPQLKFIPDADTCFSKPLLSVDVGWGIQKGDSVFQHYLQGIADEMSSQLKQEEQQIIQSLSS